MNRIFYGFPSVISPVGILGEHEKAGGCLLLKGNLYSYDKLTLNCWKFCVLKRVNKI